MPFLTRRTKPTLHYRIDDFTDPWKKSGAILLQHGYARSSQFWHGWVPYLSRFYQKSQEAYAGGYPPRESGTCA